MSFAITNPNANASKLFRKEDFDNLMETPSEFKTELYQSYMN